MDTSVSPALWRDRKTNITLERRESCQLCSLSVLQTQHNVSDCFVDNARRVIPGWNMTSSLRLESTCRGIAVILHTWEATRNGSHCRLLRHSSDLLPHSFQVCTVAGSLFGLNCNVCSTNSILYPWERWSPLGLKWTLASLFCYSFAQCLPAWPQCKSSRTHTHTHTNSLTWPNLKIQYLFQDNEWVHIFKGENCMSIFIHLLPPGSFIFPSVTIIHSHSLWAGRPDSQCGSHTQGRQRCGNVCRCRQYTQLDMVCSCS